MDTCLAKVYQKDAVLEIVMDKEPFAFSALPVTAQELENAFHKDELPPHTRTTIRVLGQMRGVGGIDSWGADVEEQYRVSGEKEYELSFFLRPGKKANKK